MQFDAVCTVHHPAVCMWNNKIHKILVIRLYFPLDTLHVSDYISPSSGATFISCTSHLVYAGMCRYVWLLCGYSHSTARRMVPAYTNCDIRLQNVAPGNRLKSMKRVEHLTENKDTFYEFRTSSWSTYIQIAIRCTVHTMSNCHITSLRFSERSGSGHHSWGIWRRFTG